MRRLIASLLVLALGTCSALAISPTQVTTILPAWQAPGWSGWTPSSLGSSLKADWTADDHGTARMTDDGAGLISSWTDASGGMVITAATTARPTWAANSFVNQSSGATYSGISCDGVANAPASTTLTTIPTGATAGEEWVLTDSTQATGSSTAIISYGAVSGAAMRQIRHTSSAPARVNIFDGVTNANDTVVSFSGPHAIGGFFSGTLSDGMIDGRPHSAPGTIASLNTTATRFRLCANTAATAGAFYAGVLRRAIVTLDLSASISNGVGDRVRMMAYLVHSVGMAYLLPSNHPYRYRAP